MEKYQGNILIGGDLFPSEKNMDSFVNGDIDSLFDSQIQDMFSKAGFSICNLEGALTDETTPIQKCGPIIKATPKTASCLSQLGVDCVTLANNHIMDYGEKGYLDTCQTLDSFKIEYFGAGYENKIIRSHIIQVGKYTIAFYTVAETMFNVPTEKLPGAYIYDEYNVIQDIQSLKSKCDYLIVIYHGGTEFYWYNTSLIRERFHRMADNGADAIIAQHTHCIGIQENYNDSFLLYGQGDFLFARSVNEYKASGLLLEVNVDNDGLHFTRHLLKHVEGKVIYDPEQNFDFFDNRDAQYKNGEYYLGEYKKFSDEKVIKYLECFRGKNLLDKVVRKVLPRKSYIKYLKNTFTEKNILNIISALEFEEFRESNIQALWDIIENHKTE